MGLSVCVCVCVCIYVSENCMTCLQIENDGGFYPFLYNFYNNTYVLKSPRESLMLSNLASNDNLTWTLLKLKMLWNVVNSSSTLIIRHQ